MNPRPFLNLLFQWAALNNFAKLLDKTGTFETDASSWPEYGQFATHDFGDDEHGAEPKVRMVCWAEMGPQKLNEIACQWWKDQGADPDKFLPGVTDLHRE